MLDFMSYFLVEDHLRRKENNLPTSNNDIQAYLVLKIAGKYTIVLLKNYDVNSTNRHLH